MEKNGYGKKYWNKILRFEGEFLNDKKFGKGKEYNYEGKLIFEGEYKYGKKNGKGKEYDGNENLIYEGDYLNGKRWIKTNNNK